jgi:peptidoglycan/LPS O-acetylase OafA/YrhL
MQRYQTLDTFRFLAALLVGVHHTTIHFELFTEAESPLIAALYSFVDFFFIISGFVIAINYAHKIDSVGAYLQFLRRRLARIYPLHLLTLAIFAVGGTLAVRHGLNFDRPYYFDPKWLPENLLLIHAWGTVPHRTFNGPSWSISAEFFVYLLFPLFAFLASRARLAINLLLLAAFIVILGAAREAYGLKPWYDGMQDFGNLRAVPCFFAGVLLAEAVRKGMIPGLKHGLALSFAALAASLVVLQVHGAGVIADAMFLLTVALIVTADRGAPGNLLTRPIFRALGDASYAFYMLQMGVIAFVMIVARRTVGIEGGWGFACAGAVLVITTVLAVFTYRYFENPARRLLQGRSVGAKARPASVEPALVAAPRP